MAEASAFVANLVEKRLDALLVCLLGLIEVIVVPVAEAVLGLGATLCYILVFFTSSTVLEPAVPYALDLVYLVLAEVRPLHGLLVALTLLSGSLGVTRVGIATRVVERRLAQVAQLECDLDDLAHVRRASALAREKGKLASCLQLALHELLEQLQVLGVESVLDYVKNHDCLLMCHRAERESL